MGSSEQGSRHMVVITLRVRLTLLYYGRLRTEHNEYLNKQAHN